MTSNLSLSFQVVDTQSELEGVVKKLQTEKAVAVDLEADSMFHFKEKVCLIQMAGKGASVVIDPLKIKDLSALKPLFFRKDIQKVFHGADYDVRSLYRDFGIEIRNLFDTQLACRFLGLKETSLEAVLLKWFDVRLDKKYQKKDWSQRPMPNGMMEYAAKDVMYLVRLAGILEKEIEEKGRRRWMTEECEYLSTVRSVSDQSEPLFLRFKGAGKLNPRSLAVLEALLQFRLKVAEKKDRPLFKIFGNNSLMTLAISKPESSTALEETKALSRKQIDMYGDAVKETIHQALKMPETDLPLYPHQKVSIPDGFVRKRINALKSWRETKARTLKMEPALICNKTVLTAIAEQNPTHTRQLKTITEMKNWQRNVFGQEIIAVLRRTAS